MNIIVVGPDSLLSEGLECLLERRAFEILADIRGDDDPIEAIRHHRPDAVVIYVAPPIRGVDLVRSIKKEFPEVAVVVVAEPSDAAVARGALDAGGDACVASTCPADVLVEAIHNAPTRSYVAGLPDAPDPVYSQLTPRERQILTRIAEGSTSQEIADALGIRYKTVDSHRQNLARKLHASGIAELVKHAIRARLVSLQ